MKMTREEAIETLGHVVPFATQNGEKIAEAIDMAIEALHREEAEANGYCHRINYIPKPCENANCDCVEVVRCKDCKQRRVEGKCTHYYYCDFMGSMCGDNEYCSFGERRET